MKDNIHDLYQSLSGQYKIAVVSADGKDVIWESPDWQRNLIINNGMDLVASTSYAALFTYAIAGNGTRVNKVYSGNANAGQSGTTVTLTPGVSISSFTQSLSGFTQLLQVGDVIAYDTSSAVTVVSVSNTTCTVSPSQTVSPNEAFTIWKTSQTSLHNDISRAGGNGISGSYYLVGFCGSQWIGNTLQLYRTYDFGVESGPISYTEIGVGSYGGTWNVTSNPNTTTFSRILLDTPVPLVAGQRLRVAYQLNISVQPTSSVYRSGGTVPVITNWPVSPAPNLNATESLQSNLSMIETVDSSGNSINAGGGLPLDPVSNGFNCGIWISTNGVALTSFPSAIDRSTSQWTVDSVRVAYPGAGSYYCDKTGTFGLTVANSTALGSMGIGYTDSNATIVSRQAYAMVFAYSQSKSNVQTLSLTWRFNWTRTLSNGA